MHRPTKAQLEKELTILRTRYDSMCSAFEKFLDGIKKELELVGEGELSKPHVEDHMKTAKAAYCAALQAGKY